MRTRRLAQVLLCPLITLFSLTACLPKFQEVYLTGLPIMVSQPGDHDIDTDVIIGNAQRKVQEILPGAYLSFFSFTGKCQNLAELHGQIVLDFIQVKSIHRQQRILVASVSIDTERQIMEIRTKDYSTYHWSTEGLTLRGLKVQEIGLAVREYLDASESQDCTAILARGGANDLWTVRCGPPDKVSRECLEVDPFTGKITAR